MELFPDSSDAPVASCTTSTSSSGADSCVSNDDNQISWAYAKYEGKDHGSEKDPKNADGSASPTNIPLQIGPPKPARVVAPVFASPLVNKRKLNEDPSRVPSPLCLGSGRVHGSSAERTLSLDTGKNHVVHISDLLDELMVEIFSFVVSDQSFFAGPWCVCKAWHKLCSSKKVWRQVPSFFRDGNINTQAFRFLGLKNQGTEGMCFKVFHRRSGRLFAMKKARVYPTGEGVPYYMLRELAFLKGLKHPHIATVDRISLVENKLYLFFRYMEKSLFDLINPHNDANGGLALPHTLIRRFLYQILQGVAFCHQRGVLHRNLKPKHLLVDIPMLVEPEHRCIRVDDEKTHLGKLLGMDEKTTEATVPENENKKKKTDTSSSSSETLESSCKDDSINKDVYSKLLQAAEHGNIRISDFALVRSTSIPLRNYTTEVVTLWYRSPEVLMGGQYYAAVDVWSVGCVFAEMILGKPFFPGICEIDQLFQIFLKLGTPDEETWEGFSSLPNYHFSFPNWKKRSLKVHVPTLDDDGLDLMGKMLDVNPDRRITAEEALLHPYFDSVRTPPNPKKAPSSQNSKQHRFQQKEAADAEFCISDNEITDLNAVSWEGGSENYETSCWKYSKDLHDRMVGSNSFRARQGLDDPLYLVRYYHYLKNLEAKMYPLEDYMVGGFRSRNLARTSTSQSSTTSEDMTTSNTPQVQSDLLPVHRSMLVDWLVEVIDVFEMSVRSVFMAVNYTDRYLALEKVERRRFQLLGATCLHIASKCEDVSYIGVEDLVVCADKVYKPEDVLQLEEHVLNALDFRISVPTVIDFLNVFVVRLCFNAEEDARCTVYSEFDKGVALPLMEVSETCRFLASYMAELSLQEHFFIPKLPSMVAAAALVLSLYYRNQVIIESRIQAVTGYTLEDLKECILHLRQAHGDAPFRLSLRVILRRYQRESMHSVADLESKPDLSGLYGKDVSDLPTETSLGSGTSTSQATTLSSLVPPASDPDGSNPRYMRRRHVS